MELISDPIYGDISFDEEEQFAFELISTSIFQRTRNLKQLGLCYRSFVGATQTRFSHCIGAYYLARKLLMRKEFVLQLDPLQIKTIKAAALLHDIGHGPHSHGFEWYLKELDFKDFEHEKYSAMLITNPIGEIASILKKYQINPNHVALLIAGKCPQKYPKWASRIVSSQIDVDRLDYLIRDEHFALQTTNNMQNLLQLIDQVHIDQKHGVLFYKEANLRLINDFLYTRYKMYEELYLKNEVNNWYRLVILMLLEIKKLYNQHHVFLDEYHLFHYYENMFLQRNWTTADYLQLDDLSFELFLKSMSFENVYLKKLYHAYEVGDFQVLKDQKLPKKVTFYQHKKPIYIWSEKQNKLVKYEESQDFSKIFKIRSAK